MTPERFRDLRPGDIIQDRDTGKAFVVASEYDAGLRSVAVYDLKRVGIDDAAAWQRTTWP